MLVCGSDNCEDMYEDGSNVGLAGTTQSDWDWLDDCCTYEKPILDRLRQNFKYGEV